MNFKITLKNLLWNGKITDVKVTIDYNEKHYFVARAMLYSYTVKKLVFKSIFLMCFNYFNCSKKSFQLKIICCPADLKCLVYSTKMFQLSLKLTSSNLTFQVD